MGIESENDFLPCSRNKCCPYLLRTVSVYTNVHKKSKGKSLAFSIINRYNVTVHSVPERV